MKTKHYLSKKITFAIFGEKYYHYVKSKKILLDFLLGRDYDEINSMISKILKVDSVVLDIGANMGQYLSRLSKIVKKGQIICVEPIPSNINALQSMKNYLRLNQCTIIAKAISEKIGRAVISIPKMNGVPITTQASLLNSTNNKSHEIEYIEVETTTIDIIVEEMKLTELTFIKVDTEGFDDIVIYSGIKSISKYKPILKVEGDCFGVKYSWIFDLGYKAFKLHDGKLVLLENEIDNKKYRGDTFLVHTDKIEEILFNLK